MEERAKALANILGSCITSAVNSAAQDSAVIDRSKRSHEYSCHDLEAHAHPAALIQITSAGPARVINPVAPQPAAIVPQQQQLPISGASASLQATADQTGLQFTAKQAAADRAYQEAKALLLQQQLALAGANDSLQKAADITAAVRACEEATSLMQQQPRPQQQQQLALSGASASLQKSADHTGLQFTEQREAAVRAYEEAKSLQQQQQHPQQPRRRQQQPQHQQQNWNHAQKECVTYCLASSCCLFSRCPNAFSQVSTVFAAASRR